jgi:2-methylcitrate dehydratase PrpD
MNDPVRKLCQFVESRRFEDIPRTTVEHAKRVVMDTVGVILAGSQEAHLQRLVTLFSPLDHPGTSTRLGHPEKLSPMHAALLNGAAGSTRELEEGNNRALGHPGIQLIPAALAHAESLATGGKRFLEGVILGYEVAGRIGSSAPLRKGFHPSGTWGTVGAAASVAKISGLQATEIFEMANIASSLGITAHVENSFTGKNVSQMYAALSNYFGILSYHLFQCGFSASPENVRMTFGQLVSEGMKEERLSRGLGDGYLIEKNYFKLYPACRFTHPALDALRVALKKEPIEIDRIDRIDVYTFQWALHMAGREPENIDAMRFSIPHLLGLYLASGSVSLKTMEEFGQYEEKVKTIAGKTHLHEDERMSRMFPGKRGSSIVITLQNGSKVEGSVDDCEGGEFYPYSVSQLEAKFLDLCTPVLGNKKAAKALGLLKNIESLDRIDRLTDLLGLRTDHD